MVWHKLMMLYQDYNKAACGSGAKNIDHMIAFTL